MKTGAERSKICGQWILDVELWSARATISRWALVHHVPSYHTHLGQPPGSPQMSSQDTIPNPEGSSPHLWTAYYFFIYLLINLKHPLFLWVSIYYWSNQLLNFIIIFKFLAFEFSGHHPEIFYGLSRCREWPWFWPGLSNPSWIKVIGAALASYR